MYKVKEDGINDREISIIRNSILAILGQYVVIGRRAHL